jgi:hypothetical protein
VLLCRFALGSSVRTYQALYKYNMITYSLIIVVGVIIIKLGHYLSKSSNWAIISRYTYVLSKIDFMICLTDFPQQQCRKARQCCVPGTAAGFCVGGRRSEGSAIVSTTRLETQNSLNRRSPSTKAT